MPKVVAIIQARMGSTRLPGKVMMDLGGKEVLEWCHRAADSAPGVDEVWIATSTEPADDIIEDWCDEEDIDVFRGSETDVLDRFYHCNQEAKGDIILRLTGDCPFLDPQVIGGVVRLMLNDHKLHFASNVSPRTYPDGLDVQAMSKIALAAAWHEAHRPIDRDCVCTWIERNRSRFPSETLINPIAGMQDERWVLDTKEDLDFCQAIASEWPWHRKAPSMLDIARILDKHPTFRDLNSKGVMNERYFQALAEEPVHERTFERSERALAHAESVIPLGAQTFSKSKLQYAQPCPLFLSHGDGALVWDVDGNEYVDLVSALLPNVLGYRDADVDVEIRRQLSSGISFSLAVELETELAETIRRLVPSAEMVRFGKTGTDVTTAAVRLARAYTNRDRVLICGGYHGWADWSVERNRGVPDDVHRLTTRVKYGETFKRSDTSFAAIIVEPESQPGYLDYLRGWANDTGTVLIFDEVITGFRFDLGGAQKLYGVTPDLACFGKAMANGMPLSAVTGRRDIMLLMAPPNNIFYSGTFFGETLSIAAALATIRKMEREHVIEKLRFWGRELAHGAQTRINATGLQDFIKLTGNETLKRLSFHDADIAALFRREMAGSGTLIAASHNISFSHRGNEVARILRSYDHALHVVSNAILHGTVKEKLAGSGIAPAVR